MLRDADLLRERARSLISACSWPSTASMRSRMFASELAARPDAAFGGEPDTVVGARFTPPRVSHAAAVPWHVGRRPGPATGHGQTILAAQHTGIARMRCSTASGISASVSIRCRRYRRGTC
jgi:hypothetical protein